MALVPSSTPARLATLLAAALALALGGAACGGDDGGGGGEAGAEEPIRIAMVSPLTGNYAPLGTDNREAARAAVRWVNENGGIDGRRIVLDVRDDATEPDRALVLTREIVNDDRYLAMLGTSFSSAAFAAEPVASQAGMPYVSLAGSARQVEPIQPFVYMTPPTSAIVADKMGEYLQREGLTRIALLRDNGGYPTEGAEDVREIAPKYGLEIVAEHVFGLEAREFTASLTKIKNSNADAVWLWNVTPQSVTITKEFKSLGLPQRLVLTHGNATPFYLDPACPQSNGAVIASSFAQVAERLPDENPSKELALQVREQLGEEPSQFHYDGYSGVLVLAEAMRRVEGELTREAINEAIEGMTFVGPEGIYRFSRENHGGPGRDSVVIETIEDCKLVPVPGQDLVPEDVPEE